MLTGFVSGVGGKLAERWAAAVVLPGLVFTAALATAATLRQSHWSDVRLLRHRLDVLAAPGGSTRTAVLLLGVLAVSCAAGLVAEGLAGPYERALLGSWPRPLSRLADLLTERRRRRWNDLDQACGDAERRGEDARRLGEREARRNAVSLVEPDCPTWTGDRLRAPAERTRREYQLELGESWARLWLLLPERTRQPLSDARQRLDEAMRLGGWAVLYLLLGVVWWPAAVAGAATLLLARRRGRERAEAYAELTEAAVDVHLPSLFERFDEERHPVRPSLGPRLTERFRKGAGARRF